MKINLNIRAKMLLYILVTTILIYILVIGYTSLKLRSNTLSDAKKLVDSFSNKSANLVKSYLDTEFGASRVLANVVLSYKNIPDSIRRDIYDDILKHTLINTPNCISTWTSYELKAFDNTWAKPFGRARTEVYKKDGKYIVKRDSMDLTSNNMQSSYYQMKVSKVETIIEPYFYSYTNSKDDEILITSICVPVLEDNKFIGLAGLDISLAKFEGIISRIKPFENSYAFLVSNEGKYIAHPSKELIGKLHSDINAEEDIEYSISERIKNGDSFSLILKSEDGNEIYVSFSGFRIGNTKTPWSLGIVTPVSKIIKEANTTFIRSIIIGLIGLILVTLVIWIISYNITHPLIKATRTLENIAKGDIDQFKKLSVNSNDEIGLINKSVNVLIDGLNSTAEFAKKIGTGNLEAKIELLSDKDVLGKSIEQMQKNLIKAKEDEIIRKQEEAKNTWANEGLAKFGEILRESTNNLEEFGYNIISNLIIYINANQGGIFVINEENKDNIFIELISCYAYNRKKFTEKKIELGEGLVGQCILEAETIHITDVPQSYIEITSGLGDANPNSLLIVPLKINEQVYGAFEIASFNEFEPHVVEFIEKIAESVASSISNVKINMRTSKLLEATKTQAEELSAQEEEMRQNMEELQATQEEAARREKEMAGIVNALNTSFIVCEYDPNGKVLEANEKFCTIFKQTRNELIGKQRKDFLTKTDEDNKLWNDVKTGNIVKTVSNQQIGDSDIWLSETYAPIFDNEGNLKKIICIAADITDTKNNKKE